MSYETIKIIKGHRYGYRVESYRIDGKIRQRILEYHGRLDKVEGGEDSGKPTVDKKLAAIKDSFSKTIFDFIGRHDGVSTAAISKFYFKRKGYIIPILEGLREKGLVVYDRGNWYGTDAAAGKAP